MNDQVILFETFIPGEALGELSEVITTAQLDQWSELYPWDRPVDNHMPMSLATVLMMRAYLATVTPRPPGNLHTRQRMRLHSAMPIGEPVTTRITCLAKELRRGRRVVDLLATGTGADSRLFYEGTITLYWAA